MTLARALPRLLALSIVLGAMPAAAQVDPVKLADRLNKKALEDYDALEFDSARTTLQSAISKLRENGLDETPTAARTYVNLGMVYLAGFKDRNRAMQQFVEALKIDGTVQIDPEHVTPELQEVFDEAQKKVPHKAPVRAAPKPVEEPEETEVAPAARDKAPTGVTPGVHGIAHNSVDEAKVNQEVIIRAQMGPDVQATRMFVFYRSGAQEDYTSIPMEVSKRGDWFATIPGEAVIPKTVQYYIEARDKNGRPAVAAGSAASPYIIVVAAPERVRRGEIEEHPLENANTNGGRNKVEVTDPGRGYGRLFFNLMGGTGFGVESAGNQYEVAYQYKSSNPRGTGSYQPLTVVSTGGAWSGLHGLLEIGVNVTPRIAVSVVGRLQGTLINNADSSDPAAMQAFGGGTQKEDNAAAGMVRVRYNLLTGRFKPSVHVGFGGGEIRHVLDVSDAETDARPLVDLATAQYYAGTDSFHPMAATDPYYKADGSPRPTPIKLQEVCLNHHSSCFDNIAIGYVLASVGGSVYYDLTTFRNGGIGVIADFAAIFAFGGTNPFGMNFDLSLGIGGHFL